MVINMCVEVIMWSVLGPLYAAVNTPSVTRVFWGRKCFSVLQRLSTVGLIAPHCGMGFVWFIQVGQSL